jgi:prolyl-tRNA editing enzyme YbaK/EbsC (Cys-tRNA(Pro) deacylase)/predicted Fe-S protein YdhL (DUF1289 family)
MTATMCGAELARLPEGVQRVAAFLQQAGHPNAPQMLDDAARTAQQAADALGVELGQIAKSIVFRRKPDDMAVMVVTAGDRRVDEKKVQALVCGAGQRLGRADADFVKASTGFSIGGVAPVAHAQAPVLLIDASLRRFNDVWAAAGHPHAVFRLSPAELEKLTWAPAADVTVTADMPAAVVTVVPLTRESAVAQVMARAILARNGADDSIPSPCISVCRINTASSLCEGCFRTLGEISAWGRSDAAGKRRIWAAIQARISSSEPS